MKNPIAIVTGIISLLLTGLCCVGGIGFGVYRAYQARQAAMVPPGMPTMPPGVPPVGGPTGTPPIGAPVAAGNVGGLLLGQTQSNYGNVAITPGVDAPPVGIVSGATATDSIGFSELTLNPVNNGACRGYGTAHPDYIFTVGAPLPLLNVAATATAGGDTTLVIHSQGRFWCSDDDGGNLNPLVQLQGVAPGQYDVWVGSYAAGQNVQTTLTLAQH